MRTRLAVLPLALLLLTGCASSPEAEVREGVRDVLAAANDQDAGAVRSAVEDLLSTLRAQVGSGELTDAEAAPIRDAARAISASVAELEAEESPTPTPEPTPEETESPSPTPSPTPEPTESPTPEPTPEPTQPAPTQVPETEAPEPDAPEGEGEGEGRGRGGGKGQGDEGDDDQATVVPQLPASPGPSPSA